MRSTTRNTCPVARSGPPRRREQRLFRVSAIVVLAAAVTLAGAFCLLLLVRLLG
jgi:hypothetical protein